MSKIVIRAEGLSKRYRVGERERYLALRDVLTRAFRNVFRSIGRQTTIDYLWALRDVSFDVRQGDVIGLVGRNGAVRGLARRGHDSVSAPGRRRRLEHVSGLFGQVLRKRRRGGAGQ